MVLGLDKEECDRWKIIGIVGFNRYGSVISRANECRIL
jgi:hypothetical protein